MGGRVVSGIAIVLSGRLATILLQLIVHNTIVFIQPCVEINISLDIFDKYLSIYLFTKILRIFIYLFISKSSNNI